MGFRFSKSIRLPGGFRLNVSKSGIGVSAGIPGLRIGTGPRGHRVTASVPGTGLSWSTSLGGGRSRAQPARPQTAARAAQERLAAEGRDAARMAEHHRAAHEVALFENRIAMLTSMHKEAWRPWDWPAVAAAPPPPNPADHESWRWYQRIAQGILAGDVEACRAAITYLGPFDALTSLGTSLDVAIERSWCVEAWFAAQSADVVPTSVLSLTPTGKLSKKPISKTRYWEIYQDYVCSAALRIGREIFALLPIPVAFVHATMPLLDPARGAVADTPVLSVAFERERLLALDFDRIDPSDAVSAFDHAMKLKKTTGFTPIVLLSPDDAGVDE